MFIVHGEAAAGVAAGAAATLAGHLKIDSACEFAHPVLFEAALFIVHGVAAAGVAADADALQVARHTGARKGLRNAVQSCVRLQDDTVTTFRQHFRYPSRCKGTAVTMMRGTASPTPLSAELCGSIRRKAASTCTINGHKPSVNPPDRHPLLTHRRCSCSVSTGPPAAGATKSNLQLISPACGINIALAQLSTSLTNQRSN